MFSSAFKSFASNITSNYEISKQPTANAGAWTIFDAKKKSTNSLASIFVFKRESLDVGSGSFGAKASATSIRKVQDEIVERLKKEASSLARLRHPSILQLVEPVEDTRSGGLMFATEPVLASLSGALEQKDRGESTGRNRSDWDTETAKPPSDVELDELEIQKGLLQIAKGLEFLHGSAKLVHGNLTPDAIFINAKSDWKISGLAFAGPPDGAEGHQPIPQLSLSEALHNDPRIPRFVQLNLDYTSPDFVLDSNITFAADIFSLGLVLLACYRRPHTSPIETHGNQSTYKKICSSASTVPNPGNNYLCANSLPQELSQTLPRVLARRPAQRMNAVEFQQSQYFDNILVNTMRFLDALPAKTPAEKSQFMRGFGRVMPQFPKSVLGKKVLSAFLDEMKDRDLLALILQNVFQIIKIIPSSQDAMSDKVLPQMREVFLSKAKSEEGDKNREAGLLVVLENIQLIANNCTAKQFKDDLLPIIHVAMESSTHSLTDAALQTLPVVLPLLDFSTVKHDLFPVVASVFAKTSSLSIKIRGLEALGVLCGVQTHRGDSSNDLGGNTDSDKPDKNRSSLDKFTMQEKVVPLLKAIKTKEPAVMMAAQKVLRQVGAAADVEFIASDLMPILWTFALGPLLDLSQFKAYMDVINSLSTKVEREHTRKLQELGSSRTSEQRSASMNDVSLMNGGSNSSNMVSGQDDFEKLVIGNKTGGQQDPFAGALSDGQRLTQNPPTFSWSSATAGAGPSAPALTERPSLTNAARPTQPISRSITPDVSMSSFPSLQPAAGQSSVAWGVMTSQNNMQQQRFPQPMQSPPLQPPNYSSTTMQSPLSSPSNAWSSGQSTISPPPLNSAFSPMLAPPPGATTTAIPRQPNYNINSGSNALQGNARAQVQAQAQAAFQPPPQPAQPAQPPVQRGGLDKYQSLL